MSNKQWRMRNGEYINIEDMDDSHLNNAIQMLQRKGFITSTELESFLSSEPDGEQALDLYLQELNKLKTHPALDAMVKEQRRRKAIQ